MMGLFENARTVVMKEDEEARDYLRRLERLLDEEEAGEIEEELDWIGGRILAGEEIRKGMKKTGMDGILLKEVSLDYSDGNIALDYYLILPKMNVLVAYGGYEEALTRSREQMKAMKELKLKKASWLRRLSMNLYFQDFFRPLVVVENEGEIPKDAPGNVVSLEGLAEKLKELDGRSNAKRLPHKELEKEAQRILKVHREIETYYQDRFEKLVKRIEKRKGR